MNFKNLLIEEKAQGDMGAIYMLIVVAIAALVIIFVAKPMFTQSQKIVPKQQDIINQS